MDKLAKWCIWLRRRSFFRVAQRTFAVLMPIATVGAFFQVLQDSIFAPESFIYNLFDFDKIMSDRFWDIGTSLSQCVVEVIFSLFCLFTVYFAASFTAKIYRKDATMAGISALTTLLIMIYLFELGLTGRISLLSGSFLSFQYTFFALLLGYGVGQIFHWLGADYEAVDYEHTKLVQDRALRALKPTLVTVIGGIVLGGILYAAISKVKANFSLTALITPVENSNNLLLTVPATALASFLSWLGIEAPINSLSNVENSAAATANLTYVLRRGSVWKIPYPYLGGSLISTYGVMGGCGAILALAVAILIWGRRREPETVAKMNLWPLLFSSSRGFLIGLPVILNPIYVLQLIFVPVVNMLIAALAITLRLVPTPVYTVLTGTPGPLVAFFATNGNWPTLFFTIFLFCLDVVLMIPAVKLDNRTKVLLRDYEMEDDRHV
ncbi:PTS cellobiose transporter subunit IIC [Lactobacillus nasalidis]|uniref:PTS cellobiose transporter subunit IIC n=1 Tax=Lactobacillus nasalidis TaxID=2797258 RepID=A0ABQ3W4Y9_9LACO|nr:PTS sugar transporter subunit IIC [Lactobacillus nasalidis]GHV97794.1 PTS cellobiose transporter subunit IIC [Lactobacillus nasalidis]GHV99782.1 PTS cellobiose transporter subunit IIC [Lactobacillus nasalidis]GHW01511.1 PTS cellobiose transporter subunit IIC [Lactobacillus nasalidis]